MRKKARVFSGYTIRRHAFGALWNALNRWRWVQGRLKFGFWKNLGRSKACTEGAGRTGKFPCCRPVPGLEGFCARVPQACLPRVSAAWWGLHARGPLPVAVPSPERSPRPGNSTPEWQSAVEGRNRVEGRKGGRAGSVGRRGGLTRERQKTPTPPKDQVGFGGQWGREAPRGHARVAHTHLPLPLPARPAEAPSCRGPRAHTRRAHAHCRSLPRVRAPPVQSQPRSFKAGRALRRSRRCLRAAAMAAPSSGNPPPAPPTSPSWKAGLGGLQALTSAPRPGPVWPNRREAAGPATGLSQWDPGGGASGSWRGCGGGSVAGRFSMTVAGCTSCSVAKCLSTCRVALLSVECTSAPTMPLFVLPTDSPYLLGARESSV